MALTHLADRAAVSRADLFSFLQGDKDITLSWLEKVADVLEVEPASSCSSSLRTRFNRAAEEPHHPDALNGIDTSLRDED